MRASSLAALSHALSHADELLAVDPEAALLECNGILQCRPHWVQAQLIAAQAHLALQQYLQSASAFR